MNPEKGEVSYHRDVRLACTRCQHTWDAQAWLIIDAGQRPDLLDQVRQGLLNHFTCPGCGLSANPGLPLLVHFPGGSPRLVFSPALPAGRQQVKQQLRELLARLLVALGEKWHAQWQAETVSAPLGALRLVLLNEHANTLAASLQGDPAHNLAEAARCYQQVIELLPRRQFPAIWASAHYNLGSVLCRLPSAEPGENLERAIQHYQSALQVFTPQAFSLQRARALSGLAAALRSRQSAVPSADLEEAIRCYSLALEGFTPQAHPLEWAAAHNSLGNAFAARLAGRRADNLEQAIQHYELALQVRQSPSSKDDWAMTQENLGNLYSYRIRGDRLENLEQSIRYHQQALEVYTQAEYPIEWARGQHNLAAAYSHRLLDDHEDNLEQAIHHSLQALSVRTRARFPREWAATSNNLANLYSERRRGDRNENLRQAIDLYQQVLEVRTRQAAPANWATTQENLANAYAELQDGQRRASLELALAHFTLALEVHTRQAFPSAWAATQVNLALTYLDRLEGRRSRNQAQAMGCLHAALEVYLPDQYPVECRRAARLLGDLHSGREAWPAAGEALRVAIQADQVLFAAAFEATKEFELAEAQGIYSLAAFAMAKAGNISSAVEVIEQGRARLLREALERGRHDLERLPGLGFGELHQRYQQAAEQYRELSRQVENRPPDWAVLMENALSELRLAAQAIRETAGKLDPAYRYFLSSLSFAEIEQLASSAPLAYLFATPYGGLALVVTAGAVDSIDLDLDSRALEEIVMGLPGEPSGGYLGAYANRRQALPPREAYLARPQAVAPGWLATLDATVRWLWQSVMGRVVGAVCPSLNGDGSEISQAVLIPCGWLGLLPLHAAWTEDAQAPGRRRYALDRVTFTYAPSAHSLLFARQGAGRPVSSLVAVDDPDGSLAYASAEVSAVAAYFSKDKTAWLDNQDASSAGVAAALGQAGLIHFATHGKVDFSHPLEGFLLLAHAERLRLRDVLELDLQGCRLAVLSACETGLPGTRLLDEVISLPAGFLQAGVPGVIGSLWSVEDASTMFLMCRFYDLWLGQGLPAPQALRLAQAWLRDTTNREKEMYFTQPGSDAAAPPLPAAVIQAASRWFRQADPQSRDFAHPFFWAAFGYTGI